MTIGHSMTDKEIIRKIANIRSSKIYFIGIGGVSMSSLALMAKDMGLKVYGSDISKGVYTEILEKNAIPVFIGHKKSKLISVMPDLVVYSLSIDSENSEYKTAIQLGIPTASRAEFLGAVMQEYENAIGVSGSHGKSTVSAMLGSIFSLSKNNPTVLCGAEISSLGGYIRGDKKYLIYEACEYRDSFLHFAPKTEIFLNLDLDHTDYFHSEEEIKDSFIKAANICDDCILCTESENLRSVKDKIKSKVYTFSRDFESDYTYKITGKDRGRYSFDLYHHSKYMDSFSLGIIGSFNVTNATATIICASMYGVSMAEIKEAVSEFYGVPRRLQFIKKMPFGDVFYDYAHHPSEIQASREALYDSGYKSICVVFAPHTYSRTKSFFKEFASELSLFSKVYITDIYGARENPITSVNSLAISQEVKKEGGTARAVSENEVFEYLTKENYDAVVLMGAGPLETIKKEILEY